MTNSDETVSSSTFAEITTKRTPPPHTSQRTKKQARYTPPTVSIVLNRTPPFAPSHDVHVIMPNNSNNNSGPRNSDSGYHTSLETPYDDHDLESGGGASVLVMNDTVEDRCLPLTW